MMATIERKGKGNILLKMVRPDDWHVHLRDEGMLRAVIAYTAMIFARAIIMPNLKPPIVTTVQAAEYRGRILEALPESMNFHPLMTLYATDQLSLAEIMRAVRSGIVHGVKLYPRGATTNSDDGVTNIRNIYPALECMQREGMPLLVHGEVTDPNVDVFDREAVFIERVLGPLLYDLPELRVVFEHVTTKQGVDFVKGAGSNISATITSHHLRYNRNDMLVGGIRPHYYCLPILKREEHRLALVAAATSGNESFFLGTDSAPHPSHLKEHACGCAGCYNAPSAIMEYAEVFEMEGKLNMLERFASFNGADFYGLPRNTDTITLVRNESEPWKLPETIQVGDSGLVVPFPQGKNIYWRRVE